VIVSVAGLSQVSKNGDSLTVELSDSSSDRVYSATFPMKGAVVDEVVMDLSDVVDLVGPHGEPSFTPFSYCLRWLGALTQQAVSTRCHVLFPQSLSSSSPSMRSHCQSRCTWSCALSNP